MSALTSKSSNMRYKGLRNANKHRCDIPPGHPLIMQSIQSPKPCGGSMAKTLAENSKLTCTSGITCAQEREYGTDWLDGMPKYSEPPKRTRTHSHTTHSSRWKIGPLSPLHTHVIALPAPECLPPLCWPLVFSGDQIIIFFPPARDRLRVELKFHLIAFSARMRFSSDRRRLPAAWMIKQIK
jgi:hypothetical protein